MVLEMAVTQIRSTVQHRHWSPPIQVRLLFNRSTTLSLSPFLLSPSLSPSHWHMEVIWELYAGLKGCAVEPRAAFQRSTLASFPLLFNPLIFNCSYVKELRWQTKGRLCPFNFFFLLPVTLHPYIFTRFSWSSGEETSRNLKGSFPAPCLCLCLAELELMGTSWLLPARPPTNEAGSLTGCKAATVQPLHTLPPLGPQHFHRGTLARS